MSTRWCKCQNKRVLWNHLESCPLAFRRFPGSEPLPVWTQLILIYGTLTPSPSSSLTYSFCNLPTDRCVTIKCGACVCVCVWTRCDLSAGPSARVRQCVLTAQSAWPGWIASKSLSAQCCYSDSTQELSLGFPEEQTSHYLILKSICLLVSIWPPSHFLSLPLSLSLHLLFIPLSPIVRSSWFTLYSIKNYFRLPPLFPSFICNRGRRQLLCTDCCNLLVGYFQFSFVNNSPVLQYNYFPPAATITC